MASANPDSNTQEYLGDESHEKDSIAIIVSKWNPEVTQALYRGALDALKSYGVEQIARYDVPGTYELPLAARMLADSNNFDAILCLGCVIRGETKHNEYISHAVADGLMKVQLRAKLPVIFGVLTPDTLEQALERAGGKYGNKGREAAIAALEMIDLKRQSPYSSNSWRQ